MKLILSLSLLFSGIVCFAGTRLELAAADKALIKNDYKGAEGAALALKSALDKSTSLVLKAAKAQSASLAQIKGSLDGEKNLAFYEKVSDPLVAVVKGYNVGAGHNIFSCPMVKKSWVQNVTQHKEVRNVYATSMLECGTQDTKF